GSRTAADSGRRFECARWKTLAARSRCAGLVSQYPHAQHPDGGTAHPLRIHPHVHPACCAREGKRACAEDAQTERKQMNRPMTLAAALAISLAAIAAAQTPTPAPAKQDWVGGLALKLTPTKQLVYKKVGDR